MSVQGIARPNNTTMRQNTDRLKHSSASLKETRGCCAAEKVHMPQVEFGKAYQSIQTWGCPGVRDLRQRRR